MPKALFLFCLLWTTHALAFSEEYFVTGANVISGERVIGWLEGELGQPIVDGCVLDRGNYHAVTGKFSGKGQFELHSLCCEYEVQVTDEIQERK